MPTETRKSFIDYRLCDNKLPIKTGRWANIDNSGTVGDEFHYVLECCSLTLIGKSFYHISKGNLLTAFPIQMYLMILTLGDLDACVTFWKLLFDTFRSRPR